MYDFIRYKLVPPVFVVVFTGLVQLIALYGKGAVINADNVISGFWGNAESWTYVILLCLWALMWLKLSTKITKGPPSPTGYVPIYKDNGMSYYIITLLVTIGLDVLSSFRLSLRLYDLMPQLLGTLNILAMVLCLYLFMCPSEEPKKDLGLPSMYLFYRGVNFHPRMFGEDVKQVTNCRIGLMIWQILVWAFFVTSVERNGFSTASFTTFILQTIYLAKFYYWEGGYFHTIDIILDRAGYYLCWGCLVWVPCFYTFTSYYFVHYQPIMDTACATAILGLGIASIYLNYEVDAQKQKFRSSEGKCNIWGKPAQYLTAFYVDHTGEKKKSLLLTSGYWGTARHLNYDFELALTLCWCLPGYGLGLAPFLYLFFLLGLLVHRVYRDEEKCSNKYGAFWSKYCTLVKFRMIPYIY